MTTIAGFVDGILDGTIPPERRDDYLRIVSDEIKRLSRLVRSMLNIARIEAGELEMKPDLFDVNDTVIKTVFTFEQPLEAKQIEVRGLDRGKVMVEADPDLIHQVVYNLIENAFKFVNEGGYIEVNYTESDAGTAVGIKNSGDGIAKDEIPHIFDRFYKTDRSRGLDKNGVQPGQGRRGAGAAYRALDHQPAWRRHHRAQCRGGIQRVCLYHPEPTVQGAGEKGEGEGKGQGQGQGKREGTAGFLRTCPHPSAW